MDGYDLIGDVHGCCSLLRTLLKCLGYQDRGGYWRHPRRQAIFVGDLIDRGPEVRDTLHLVHEMVAQGAARVLLGNHEYNAIAWHTPRTDNQGDFLHVRDTRHCQNLSKTLDDFVGHEKELQSFVNWFKTLPLFLEEVCKGMPFRVVHACWHPKIMDEFLRAYPQGHNQETFWQATVQPGSLEKRALECFTRGLHIPLAKGQQIIGNDGFAHRHLRARFWELPEKVHVFGDLAITGQPLADEIRNTPLSAEQKEYLCCYDIEQPTLFFGHYWLHGTPMILRPPNLTCLDYSAVHNDCLVAYRFDGESMTDPQKLRWT